VVVALGEITGLTAAGRTKPPNAQAGSRLLVGFDFSAVCFLTAVQAVQSKRKSNGLANEEQGFIAAIYLLKCNHFRAVSAGFRERQNISYLSYPIHHVMRHLLLTASISCCLFACKEAPKETAVVKGTTLVALPINPEKVKGLYTGDFKGSPISIMLNYVSNQHASGYNVHKGLTRNLTGTVAFVKGKLRLQLSEPGNNLYDGRFDLEIDTAKWTGKGVFTPLKKGEETAFTIKKRLGEVDPYNYGQVYMDSLSNYITLKPDGSCTYSYLTDSTATGQQLTIRGNYRREKSLVTIFWQRNAVFPTGKSVFKLLVRKPYKDDEFTQETLVGEGRVFEESIGD
jgi:hypothetical protein